MRRAFKIALNIACWVCLITVKERYGWPAMGPCFLTSTFFAATCLLTKEAESDENA